MKRKALLLLAAGWLLMLSTPTPTQAQSKVSVFDKILFYDGYNNLDTLADEIVPVPEGIFRLKTSLITTKLSEEQLDMLSGSIRMDVLIEAACDNYDRLGHVFISLVPKDSAIYNPTDNKRIEVARFITPFMNKNKQPDSVPYTFQVDYLQHIFQDQNLREQYNFWMELEVFGVPYAANEQVAGCKDRNDVFYGSLTFTTTASADSLENSNVLIPLLTQYQMRNYAEDGTDTAGQTIKNVSFTIEQDLTDAHLVLITSNHGANTGGEEYNRRWHYVYLNNEEVLRYKPGRTSCEPFRKYNTQSNGIYGNSQKTDAQWQSFSNWCPGDVIDNRIIKLGALQAGEYKFTIEVPDAVFRNGEGYFPLSLYFQGKTSGVIAGRYTIKGKVIYNNNPLSGVTFDGSLALTNPAGEYTVFADSNATITLTPKLSGYSFTPSSITCSNISDNLIDKNFIAETLGIEDMRSDKFSINIYPNPITTEIHVKLDSPEISDYAIYNFSGQIVLQGRVRNASTINVEALAKGVYYLRISNTVFKVIKN